MKKILLAMCLIISKNAFSFDGVIIVLEAPLLKAPNYKSVVLQTLRKGSRVYVPTEIGNLDTLPEFIQTYDRVGNMAYIPTKYIKIVTNELSESKMPISYPSSDPTDYRLEEPISQNYPFDDTTYIRASLAFSSGNSTKSPYDYNSVFTKQEFSSETGARLNVTRKISFDNYDRYYFGFFGVISTSNNTTLFQNNSQAVENRSLIRVGPVITYDVFKNTKYRLTLGTGFTYNYHKSSLKLSSSDGSNEERLFTGYSFSPMANTLLQLVEVIPATDIIGGVDLNLYLPHIQKASESASLPEVWGSNSPNQISTGFKPQVAFFLGVQVKY